MISVLIADDQDLVREGLRMLLEAEPDICVREAARHQGAAGTGGSSDVVVMDIRMPEVDGIEATALLIRAGCRARILIRVQPVQQRQRPAAVSRPARSDR